MKELTNIRTLSREELKSVLVNAGEKAFRSDQLFKWIWEKNVGSFDEMLNLSKDLRTKWAHFEFHLLSALSQVKLLWVKHPLIWAKVVVFATDDKSKVTELSLVLALNKGVSCWHMLLGH